MAVEGEYDVEAGVVITADEGYDEDDAPLGSPANKRGH